MSWFRVVSFVSSDGSSFNLTEERRRDEQSRAAAEYCARTLGWKRIECTEPVAPDSEERRMRTIESINDEILKELEKVL